MNEVDVILITKKELEEMTKKAYKEGYADADAGRASRYDKDLTT